jgi:hypothetical protein
MTDCQISKTTSIRGYGSLFDSNHFTIQDEDIQFNFNIIMNILYIEGANGSKPVLHILDEATRFQARRRLKHISARHVWDQLRTCCIDTYLGPPDLISSDAGKQFSMPFCSHTNTSCRYKKQAFRSKIRAATLARWWIAMAKILSYIIRIWKKTLPKGYSSFFERCVPSLLIVEVSEHPEEYSNFSTLSIVHSIHHSNKRPEYTEFLSVITCEFYFASRRSILSHFFIDCLRILRGTDLRILHDYALDFIYVLFTIKAS